MSDQATASKPAADARAVDRRGDVSGPGMHVLVIGVSAYDGLPEPSGSAPTDGRKTFGLLQLQSAATTACRFLEFLLDPPAGTKFTRPLKTCRLLLCPHATEDDIVTATRAKLNGGSPLCATTNDIIRACSGWRKDAEDDGREAMTIFYFVGHGFQVKKGSEVTMLPHDFAPTSGEKLRNAFSLSGVREFMYGSTTDQRKAPLYQYYFVDACRTEPRELEAPSKRVALEEPSLLDELENRPAKDDRKIACFFAARSGRSGWARPGVGSYFGTALRAAMAWAAVKPNESAFNIDGPVVTPESLIQGIKFEFGSLLEKEISANHIEPSDVINEDGNIDLPIGPGEVEPGSILPLLTLDELHDCRVRFTLRPPGRGASDMHVDFRVKDSSEAYACELHSGPLVSSPRYWESPDLRYWARVRRTSEESEPLNEKKGDLLRPADNVRLDWSS